MGKPFIPRPRRVVTGHDGGGRSVILSDGDTPVLVQPEHAPTSGIAEIWRSDELPPSNAGDADGALLPFTLTPPPRGLVARVVHFPPDRELNWSEDDARQVFAQYGGSEALANEGARHAAFHRTESLDFALVLEGEIWALMDVGETLMRKGDILVQRGTSHAWANRSDRPCRVLFAAVAARPLAAAAPAQAGPHNASPGGHDGSDSPRRIVTGHDAQGRSVIAADGPSPFVFRPDPQRPLTFFEIWREDRLPADNDSAADGALLPFGLEPSAEGVLCRVVDMPPDTDMGWDGETATRIFASIGGESALSAQPQRHAAFHRTESLDFIAVMEGEIWALVEDGEVLLKEGDVLVQRGTNHAWANRSGRTARLFAVMNAARPLPRGEVA